MKANIVLNKEVSERLFKEVSILIDNKDRFEEVLDNKLINELFSRRVALYVDDEVNKIEVNEFLLVKCIIESGAIDVSVGRIKKHVNGESFLTYGII